MLINVNLIIEEGGGGTRRKTKYINETAIRNILTLHARIHIFGSNRNPDLLKHYSYSIGTFY